ncbi:hypothetical protein HAX54_046385 [Datura stramonium]|uniref:DUF4283 domain-containing protein n=1 Tax=Datura stramonium TaxID=4076 RepID=A0ABS8WIY2_DATST|nr:hypothetical protein [Datura stramonium]
MAQLQSTMLVKLKLGLVTPASGKTLTFILSIAKEGVKNVVIEEDDINDLIKQSVLMQDDQYFLFKFESAIDKEETLSHVQLWVKFPSLPIGYWSTEALNKLKVPQGAIVHRSIHFYVSEDFLCMSTECWYHEKNAIVIASEWVKPFPKLRKAIPKKKEWRKVIHTRPAIGAGEIIGQQHSNKLRQPSDSIGTLTIDHGRLVIEEDNLKQQREGILARIVHIVGNSMPFIPLPP